jgi:hypothetical protein
MALFRAMRLLLMSETKTAEPLHMGFVKPCVLEPERLELSLSKFATSMENTMIPNPFTSRLAELISNFREPEPIVQSRIQDIHNEVLRRSAHLHQPNFASIHRQDLEFLFEAYDVRFFAGHCRLALGGSRIHFRLSRRMTSAGGTTTRFRLANGDPAYEIAIAASLLFDSFANGDRRITVGGVECNNRLQALQRVFEHELIHLAEQLCWQKSDCAAGRFQDIAERHFLHRTHTHSLVTRKERAAEAGIRIGSRVSFIFEGQELNGRVNRITKRATVLVQDPGGSQFSDGSRYKTYYVPLGHLKISELKQVMGERWDPADRRTE